MDYIPQRENTVISTYTPNSSALMDTDAYGAKLIKKIIAITNRGNNAEVRRKKDGTLTVYEVKKEIGMCLSTTPGTIERNCDNGKIDDLFGDG